MTTQPPATLQPMIQKLPYWQDLDGIDEEANYLHLRDDEPTLT